MDNPGPGSYNVDTRTTQKKILFDKLAKNYPLDQDKIGPGE
eukprot:CAMPEP_0116960604 /NCGR_PEP_ID=MMETSP0467-20121206/46046_1 /TAXON_ID=283647 /ORGANISM="Mesodinium pulex, Strain SPMC105" /LENGTH=40 /DNA_ID= /DNA_START= /DNA_END= /DNA_ORIENTATION=